MDASGLTDESTETESDRLNRELNEFLQELRVARNGILIIVGFLLVIPFTQRFANVTDFERAVYYLSFLTAGAAAVVIVAPVSYHRMVFRRHDKHSLVTRGNQMAQAGLGLLGIAILGVLVLVTDFLFSSLPLVAVVSALYVGIVGSLWYLLPLQSRIKASEPWRPDRLAAALNRPEERPAHTYSRGGVGWGGRSRTCNLLVQSELPYHLATPQRARRQLAEVATKSTNYIE